jgi:MOSC domain-containing protein YiiM
MAESNPGGRVAALFVSPTKGQPMRPLPLAHARAGHGLDGCAHARPGTSRQILLIDSEALAQHSVPLGALKENITVKGVEVSALASGTRLRVGAALLEISKDCAPCSFVDSVQPGLKEKLESRRGHRGMLARVLESGAIRVGDTIEVLAG